MPNPLFDDLLFPDWVEELRPHQEEAIQSIVRHFAERSVVFLDAPTGAGKTLIGEAVRQIVRHRWTAEHGMYLCTTKSLQDQFLHDFPTAKLIKGRSNYPTQDYPERFEQLGPRHFDAGMCTKQGIPMSEGATFCNTCEYEKPDLKYSTEGGSDKKDEMILHCGSCHPWQACPYEEAKWAALDSQLAVANTAYFLTEANHVGMFGADTKTGRPHFEVIVIDEADTLESVLMGYIELSISARMLKLFGLGMPEMKTKPESWVEWTQKSKEILKLKAKELSAMLKEYEEPPVHLHKENERVHRYLNQMDIVISAILAEPDNWILDGYKDGGVILKPVRVTSHARHLLWRHGKRFLLMSATLVSARQMAEDLGLGPNEWASVEVDSHFPVNRRPIHVRPIVSMTYKNKDTSWPRMAEGIEEILDMYPTDRVLVHTVSYNLTAFLYDKLRDTKHGERLLTYSNARERDAKLESYRQKFGAVLLAPSFDRGVDLADDDCRVIIVAKIPYPSTGDKQVSQRLHGTPTGRSWYATETIRSLVQMTGRGMRHKDDYVESYILDSQFVSNIWRSPTTRNRIPAWWSKALVWQEPTRR